MRDVFAQQMLINRSENANFDSFMVMFRNSLYNRQPNNEKHIILVEYAYTSAVKGDGN